VLHNLVLETTRSGIELKNLKMRVEALSSRLDFSERRLRALEGVVQYQPEAVAPRERRPEPPAPGGSVEPAGVPGPASSAGGGDGTGSAGAEGRKRRRRRRGRRGPGMAAGPGGAPGDGGAESEGADATDDGGDDGPELEAGSADGGAPPDSDPQAS
jgi:hypothetical protein